MIDDPVWIRAQLLDLTQQQEAAFPQPWAVDAAPRDYTDKLLGALVGIEIPIAQLTGKWKVSQNQPAVNQIGVVQGLVDGGGDEAGVMAGLVKQYNNL